MHETLRRPKPPKVVHLRQVIDAKRREEARDLRHDLHEVVREYADAYGDSLGGYALTVFDRRGSSVTAIHCQHMPFAASNLPGRVRDEIARLLTQPEKE